MEKVNICHQLEKVADEIIQINKDAGYEVHLDELTGMYFVYVLRHSPLRKRKNAPTQ